MQLSGILGAGRVNSNSGCFLYGVNKIVLCKNGEVNKSIFNTIEERRHSDEWAIEI